MFAIQKLKPDRSITGLIPAITSLLGLFPVYLYWVYQDHEPWILSPNPVHVLCRRLGLFAVPRWR